MTEPIGKVGDSQITAAARINMASDVASGVASGGKQLGTILSTLAQEFGSYSSPEQIAMLLASVRLVVGAGLPAVDVADSMYSNPIVLDALRDGNPELAKQAVISQVSEALADLRASGVPEANLHTLSASGFAAGEISSALRTVPSLREGLMQSDPSQLKQTLSALHDMFRDDGRSTHADPSILSALGERMVLGLGGSQGSWFDQYMSRIRAAQKRSIGTVRPEDHPELMLFSGTQSAPVDENSANFGLWMIAAVVGVAVLLIIMSRC
jgi:hypothetical protein